MQQLITSVVFSLLVLLLCLVRPNAGRIFLGIFFLVMAIGVNVVLVLISPNLFVALGTNDAIIPLYQCAGGGQCVHHSATGILAFNASANR